MFDDLYAIVTFATLVAIVFTFVASLASVHRRDRKKRAQSLGKSDEKDKKH